MKNQITMGEAQLPLTLQVWDDGSMSVCDRGGVFVLTVTPEQVCKLAALFGPVEPTQSWVGQPISKGPA